MEEMSPKVNFVWFAWQLHASHSGYHQIVRHLGAPDTNAEMRLSLFPRLLKTVLSRGPQRRVTYLVRHLSGIPLYSSNAMFPELDTILKMVFRRREVFHFIYGEFSYRFSGFLPRLRGSQLICTYHLPPAWLSEFIPDRHTGHLSRLDAVVVVASNQIDYFARFLPRERVFVVPHGVDTQFFRPGATSDISAGDTCLFVGDHLRDFSALRAAIQVIAARRPQTRFVAVTPERNFPHFTGLPQVVLETNLPDEQILRRYQTSALLMQPMMDCTANNSILEAMACGLPTVATDVGGVRDYLDDSCGVLVPPGDSEGLAREVIGLLGDDSRRRAMSGNSRTRALRFEWSKVATELQQVYEKVLSTSAHRRTINTDQR